MKSVITIAIILFFSQALLADEINCIGYSGFNKPSSIEKLAGDCALQKNLASDEAVQNEHRKNIYDKLADKLATQIKQNSEDISLLTAFYNANGQDLMMNSNEIAQSCRLDSIKKIENCNGKKTGAFQDKKLAMLKSKLPANTNTPFKGDQSLFGIMAGKFYSDLGMKEQGNDLQCPLEGQSGSFMIKSQLDELSATNIIDILANTTDNQDDIFEHYPQLKIIKNSNDPEFIKKFKIFAKSKPANKSAKEHISSFFFDPQNQKRLAPTLAKQCSNMNENINRFICSDITELGSLDDNTSRSLFNKLNTTDSMEDQYEVDFNDPSILTAYGMQCIAKENKLKNPNIEKEKNYQSIDQWYTNFTNNTREEDSIDLANNKVEAFCSMYTCKNPIAKKEKSCQKGGPLSSSELSHSLGCDLKPLGKACFEESLKAISYMQSLEKLKQGSKDQVIAANSSSSSLPSSSSTATDTDQQTIVSGRLPNFAENYLGVEGSLKALGKPATAYEITEKKQEFAENKLAANDPIYSTPAAVKKEVVQQQQKNTLMAAAVDTSGVQPTFTPTAMSQTTATHPTSTSPSSRIETEAVAQKATAQKLSVADTGTESSRLREEMEKMIADIKSTKQEITEVQNNMASTSSSMAVKTGTNYGTTPIVNRAEQERLRRLEQSLTEKANRLEEYRRELDNRNFAQSGFGSEGAAARSPSNSASNGGSGGGGGGMNGSSGGSSGSGNSLKLSSTTNAKVDGKGSGSNYSAALIQSGVESSTLTVDELEKLSPENLKKLGIDSSLPFTLKVTFDGQTYQVPVRSFIYKNQKILGPIMDPKNKDLNDFLLKSPLFKQYIDYRFEKESQAKASI